MDLIRGQTDIGTFIAVNHAELQIFLDLQDEAGFDIVPECIRRAIDMFCLDQNAGNPVPSDNAVGLGDCISDPSQQGSEPLP